MGGRVKRRKLNFFVEERRIRLGLNVLESAFFRHTYDKLDQGPGRCWMTLWRREWVRSPARVVVTRDELKLLNDIELKLLNDSRCYHERDMSSHEWDMLHMNETCRQREARLLNELRCYTCSTHVLHMFYACSITRGATNVLNDSRCYGVATVSRLLKMYRSLLQNAFSLIGLFCKRDL